MEVNQIYNLVNTATLEALGQSAVVQEDLSNIVDIGNELFNNKAVDKYVESLVNHIGKVVFVYRKYNGVVPSVLMDNWEYGSVVEKITMKNLPEAVENETWDLENGTVYEQNMFKKPDISVKFFNTKSSFEIDISITDKQVKQSFSNATQLNSFVSMIYGWIDNSLTVKLEEMTRRVINHMSAETVYADYGTLAHSSKSGTKAINLLYLYNEKFDKTLKAEDCLSDLDFLKFASYTISLYSERMRSMSTLFNIGEQPRFTPTDLQHIVLLAEFEKATGAYLQADTFHNDFVKLPSAETIPYWQGTGTTFSFKDTSKVVVKTSSEKAVTINGILGVIFDRDALGITNYTRYARSHYNNKAEFTNIFYKAEAGYFNDLNENFLVFFVA